MARCDKCGYNLGPDTTICPVCGTESSSASVNASLGRYDKSGNVAEERKGGRSSGGGDNSRRATDPYRSGRDPEPRKSVSKVLIVAIVPILMTVACVFFITPAGTEGVEDKGSLHHDVTWFYNNRQFSVSIDIPQEEYDYYSDYDIIRTSQKGPSNIKNFITLDGTTKDLANDLVEVYEKKYPIHTDQDLANYLLSFVQLSTKYGTDAEVYKDKCAFVGGAAEYWAFPVETLFYMKGDCEDTSILLTSLMECSGLDSSILYFRSTTAGVEGHVMSGVYLDNYTLNATPLVCYDIYGEKYDGEGKPYYGCETTIEYQLNVGAAAEGSGIRSGVYTNWPDTLVFTF